MIKNQEFILCPQCGSLEYAQVVQTPLFPAFVHRCTKCQYVIMESEWVQAEFRALTIKQPYAGLMYFGKIETRTWFTHYRGPVAIHAGSGRNSRNSIVNTSGDQAERVLPLLKATNPGVFQERGSIIAVGMLTDCRPMTTDDSAICFVEYQPGLYCHIIENIRPVYPIAVAGKLGYWKPEENVISQLKPIDFHEECANND